MYSGWEDGADRLLERPAQRRARLGAKRDDTRGARGALIVGPGGVQAVSVPRVRPVDTVGAGDCFSGWLAAGLAEGRSLSQAAERAVRAASLAVTRPGAQAGMPYRREVAE